MVGQKLDIDMLWNHEMLLESWTSWTTSKKMAGEILGLFDQKQQINTFIYLFINSFIIYHLSIYYPIIDLLSFIDFLFTKLFIHSLFTYLL